MKRKEERKDAYSMKKIGIFMADGCEEIEGLTVVDLLRRANIEIVMLSIMGRKEVTGSHKITFFADELAENVDFETFDGIILPGGMPGTTNLGANATVNEVIKKFAAEGKLVGAICAAPSVLGAAGILVGKKATSYPGFEDKLTGAMVCEDAVVVCDNLITSRGMGTAMEFGFEIITYLNEGNPEVANGLRKGTIYE